MPTGSNTVHQTFTLEAASILKHSLSWAKKRGHAHLTPLHVASTLLTSNTTALLRRACLKSQPHQTSHPLQCKALELCFNVALNRLPTTHYQQPSLSNALIAALKRAQTHQRRGLIEHRQHQPLLSMRVELKQLILSILDDPSVSRVLREVGFSSIAVKNNLEDSPRQISNSTFEPSPIHFCPKKKTPNGLIIDSASLEEDIKLVLEVLLSNKRRNIVIVGDCEITSEGLVHELMSRVERKEVPEELKLVHFVKFQFSLVQLRVMKREEVEHNFLVLKKKVDYIVSRGRGVIIYIGDLKWTLERSEYEAEASVYRAVDHLVAEIGRLVCDYSDSRTKVWLMGTASYETYMKCQMKQPSLDIQWALQAVSVPSGGLGLSLQATSVHDSRMTFSRNTSQMPESKQLVNKEEPEKLIFCAECTFNYEKEARLFTSSHRIPSLCLSSCNTKEPHKGSTPLPSWLQSHCIKAQQKDDSAELKTKWKRMCYSLHQMNPSLEHEESCHHNGLDYYFAESTQNSFENTDARKAKLTVAFGNSPFLNTEIFAALGNEKTVQHGKVSQSERDMPCSIIQALINSRAVKKERWLMIEGNDLAEKRRLASAIGESVFGSADFLLLYMNMKNGDYRKHSKDLQTALRHHEKLVLVLEDVDFGETQLENFLADGFETENLGELTNEEESSCNTLFILTKGDPKSSEGDTKNPNSLMQMKLKGNGGIQNLGTPNLDNKRKAVWDLVNEVKSRRINEKEEAFSVAFCYGNNKKEFTRQLSCNTIDLNIRPDQDEVNGCNIGQLSSISSD